MRCGWGWNEVEDEADQKVMTKGNGKAVFDGVMDVELTFGLIQK